ncbi:imidazole glycerol phosphate synthase subunit HisH [Lactobacillaceae bacterium Scapto_B20]
MIVIIDYDTGNTRNVINALNYLGIDNQLSGDRETILNADGLILPGVGSFPDAMQTLKQRNLIEPIKQVVAKGKPILGICLGMQLLFDAGTEFEPTAGLGLIPGTVEPIPETTKQFKVPQMGWNVNQQQSNDRFGQIIDQKYSYFVHSYYAKTAPEYIVASTDYGVEVPSIVKNGNVIGMQFHPEKAIKLASSYYYNLRSWWKHEHYPRNRFKGPQ